MANDTITKGRVRVVAGNATTAEVNAGKVIVPADETRTITVTGGWMRALGGAVGAATSVDIADTAGTAVVAAAVARASLTENTVVNLVGGSGVTATNLGNAMTPGKGLQIVKAGSDVTTATSVDYLVEYTVA